MGTGPATNEGQGERGDQSTELADWWIEGKVRSLYRSDYHCFSERVDFTYILFGKHRVLQGRGCWVLVQGPHLFPLLGELMD